MTKKELKEKIKNHIKGCEKSAKRYKKEGDMQAHFDLKGKADGFRISLDYIKQLKK